MLLPLLCSHGTLSNSAFNFLIWICYYKWCSHGTLSNSAFKVLIAKLHHDVACGGTCLSSSSELTTSTTCIGSSLTGAPPASLTGLAIPSCKQMAFSGGSSFWDGQFANPWMKRAEVSRYVVLILICYYKCCSHGTLSNSAFKVLIWICYYNCGSHGTLSNSAFKVLSWICYYNCGSHGTLSNSAFKVLIWICATTTKLWVLLRLHACGSSWWFLGSER